MAGILEAVKKGFGIATKSLGLVLVLFVFNLIFNLVSIPLAATPGAQPAPQLTAGAIIFSVLFILISIFIQGGALGIVRDTIKEGKAKLASFASYGLKYYLRLLGLGVLILLIVVIVALIAALLVAGTAPLNNNVITTIATVIAVAIAIIVGLVYFIPFTLSPYALICDETGVISSMKKSLKLVRSPFSRVLTLLLLFVTLILISLGIGFVVGFLVGIITAVVPVAVGQVLMAIATSAINGYLGIVMMASFMTFYLSLTGKERAV